MKVIINTNRMGYKPEYPVTVQYYEADGTLGVSFLSGIRPKGNLSLTFPQNSMTMMLRSDYGQKSVTYPFFPGSKNTTYTALTLRDSGEDFNAARLRDSFFQTIDKGLDLDTIDTNLVVVYINGSYCGLYDLDEEENDNYLAEHYGLAKDNIDRINHDDKAQSGNNKEFLRVSALAKSLDLSKDANLEELAKYVDIDACTDFLVEHTYWADGDVINQRFWRARDYSVKWRPFLFDLDFSLRANNVNRNEFSTYFNPVPIGPTYPKVDNRIFCALRENKAWCDKFVQRYIQLAETQFAPSRILPIYDSLVSAMKPEMAQHIARWSTPSSMRVWESQVSALRNVLANRQAVALKQLQRYFHVSDATMQKYIAEYSAKN
jgi:hypothetical protein